MSAARRASVLALLMGAALIGVLGFSSPAAADADDEILVSLDGETWEPDIDEPLFDNEARWVPGDSETRSFWARNQADTSATMGVVLVSDDPDDLLEDDVEVSTRIADEPWQTLPPDGSIHLDRDLAAGETTKVEVRVTTLWESGNSSQRTELPFDIRVVLSQAGETPAPPDEPDGDLPATGGQVSGLALVIGAGLAAGGGVLLATRPRKRR